jgi:DNA repair photolyase
MRIISASRREDMVAFRMDEIKTAYRPDEFFVFWTKDPLNLLDSDLDLNYECCALQLTITGLGGGRLEPNVPTWDRVVDCTTRLIERGFNPKLINWRFDPYIEGHTSWSNMRDIANELYQLGITRCVTSFVDIYSNKNTIRRFMKAVDEIPLKFLTFEDKFRILNQMLEVLEPKGMTLYTCAQAGLQSLVKPSKCIDGEYYQSVTGIDFNQDKDSSQRAACGCTKSVDIGSYRECPHGCKYCYARPAESNSSL